MHKGSLFNHIQSIRMLVHWVISCFGAIVMNILMAHAAVQAYDSHSLTVWRRTSRLSVQQAIRDPVLSTLVQLQEGGESGQWEWSVRAGGCCLCLQSTAPLFPWCMCVLGVGLMFVVCLPLPLSPSWPVPPDLSPCFLRVLVSSLSCLCLVPCLPTLCSTLVHTLFVSHFVRFSASDFCLLFQDYDFARSFGFCVTSWTRPAWLVSFCLCPCCPVSVFWPLACPHSVDSACSAVKKSAVIVTQNKAVTV